MTPRPSKKLSGFELSAAIGSFISEYQLGPSEKTLAFYRDTVERALGGWLLSHRIHHVDDVTPQHLRDFFLWERQRVRRDGRRALAPSTLAQRYNAAHRFFAWCVEQQFVRESPMDRVKRWRTPEPERMAYTADEAKRLIEWCGYKRDRRIAARDRAIIVTLLGTGARAAEVCGILDSCIDWHARGSNGKVVPRLTLHGKGSRDRRVPLGPKAADAIRAWMRVRYECPTPHLFVTQRHSAMTTDALEKMVEKMGEYAGVPNCHPHRFRHTAATELYRRTRDIKLVQYFLGHASVLHTERYLKALGADYEAGAYVPPSEWLA